MNKNELIKQLEDGNKIEEEFVSLVAYFYQHVIDNLQLPQASIAKIDAALKVLEVDSQKHKAMIQELLEQVKGGQKNDY
jgi:hypothetical protein